MKQFIIFMTVLLFLGMATTARNACSDPRTFGDNCEYQCHCAGGQACGTDGSCSNGCGSGWEGEYCQRGNVAAGRSSSTSQSSTDGSYSSSLALDGNTSQAFSSCIHTNTEHQPWWQVDLGKKYVLFTVKIWNSNQGDARECKTTQRGAEYRGTMSTTRKGFTCADWLDESIHRHYLKPATPSSNYCRNPDHITEPWCYTTDKNKRWDYCDVPWCPAKFKNFKIWMDSDICHHYSGTVNFGASPEYRCVTPVVGRYLKIQLLDSSTVLTLCEVTVEAFQYTSCRTKRYGPNCNNRCQCANDAKCNDTTGGCPNQICNDRFTGPYCNIEIPTVLKKTSSTPTSIRVQVMYNRPHDSAYDAGKVTLLDIRYNSTKDSSSWTTVWNPSLGLINFDLTPLQPSTQYGVRIRVQYSTKLGTTMSPLGPITNFQTKSCAGYMAMPVIRVTSNTIVTVSAWPNRVSLVVKAEVPQVPGMIAECNKQLTVYIKKTSEPSYVAMTKTGQTFSIDKLTAFTEYDIKATVRSPDGKEKDNIQTMKTAEDVPSAPEITKLAASLTTVTVRLTPPNPPYGVITRYTIEIQKDGGNPTMAEIGPISPSPTIDKLQSRTLYFFKARAWTSKGEGAWSKVISVITEENVPGPPRMLTVGKYSTTSLLLNWNPPKYNNGQPMLFKLTCVPVFSFDPIINSERNRHVVMADPDPEVKHHTVTGLSPATEYNCSIAAQTSKGYGPSVSLRSWTAPERAILPENLFFDVFLDETTDTTVTVVMKKMPKSLKYGFIGKVRVGIEKLSNTRRKRSAPLTTDEYSLLTDYKTAKGNGYRSYIAAELDANYSGPFVIGDGKTYGSYYNPPLETGQKYDVLFGIVFKAGEIETTSYRRYGKAISVKGSSSVALAVGLTVGLLVVLAAIIVPVVIVIRRRKQTEESSPGHINEEPMRMESRRRDLPDALGVGETNLACTVDQQEDTVYEVIQTNVEKSELSGVGTSSGGNTSTGVRPKDATQGATEEITSSIYAYAEAFPRVAVDNIYEIAVADKHDYEQTTYEALDEARMAEPGVGTSAGGYKEPRCGPSVTTKEVVNTNAAADIGDAAASDAFEGQEKENIYQNTGESLCITQASGAYENVGFSP